MTLGPLQFDRPIWLVLAPATWALSWLIARRSLAGLGDRVKWVALGARCAVLMLLAAALAEPHWRKESDGVSVIVLADASASMPPGSAKGIAEAVQRGSASAEPDDRLGVVTTAERALAQSLPSDSRPASLSAAEFKPETWNTGGRDGTDLAAGVRMAMAIKPEDTAARILLASDGNETTGSLLAAAASARAAGIPIDILPIGYAFTREVIFENIVAPPTARRGQTARIRMVLTSISRTSGRLSLLVNGEVMDISGDAPGTSIEQVLEPGKNVVSVPVLLDRSGPQVFEAVFEPASATEDTVVQNNRAMAVTFVSGQGKVVLYADSTEAAAPIQRALIQSRLEVDVRPFAGLFQSLTELQAYDAVVLIDVPATVLSDQQMNELHAYVHDAGGGLVVIGGPNSFGAGGWMNTPVAEALPVKLDPPQKRQMPRGALAIVVHSCEIPEGNYWGQQTAMAAANTLSRLDLIGVVEFGWGAAAPDGVVWAYPMSEVGDGSGVAKALKNLRFGDMPDFAPMMQQALASLKQANAAQKHCIMISDGDPAAPSPGLVQQFVDAGVTVSTVEVFPHGGTFMGTMQSIARATGGQYYTVSNRTQLADLPKIFIKEAQLIRRALIWEGAPVRPTLVSVGAETTRGITGPLPPITGYVVTAEREGLAQTTIRGPEGDPIAAQWQYGLGRTVAFTSDASGRWSSAWVGWEQFRAFWDQHVRWAMRPSGSANVSVVTESQAGQTRVIATALDDEGESLNFARFYGRVVRPDLSSADIELRQTGPGRYEGAFGSGPSGSYLLSLRYDSPKAGGGGVESGTLQAAVSRPFADEHRSLKDNTPLLRQVADLTGGRVLEPPKPAGSMADLFSRDGLVMPAALTPIWIAVTLGALGTFLVDVAVRRVRIDPALVASVFQRAFGRPSASKAGRGDDLKAARERARARGAAGAAPKAAGLDVSGAKFEAGPDPRPWSPVSPMPPTSSAVTPTGSESKADPSSRSGDDEQSMSRLLRAKRRARGESGPDRPSD